MKNFAGEKARTSYKMDTAKEKNSSIDFYRRTPKKFCMYAKRKNHAYGIHAQREFPGMAVMTEGSAKRI